MKLFQYTIRLLDSVYYAREGLTGAFTPHFFHATAINGAIATATNTTPEEQPFVISEVNGGRNRPRYKNSVLADAFYATPAKLQPGSLSENSGIAKGENDGFLQIQKRPPDRKRGLDRIDARTQPLRFCRLQFLGPETEFRGFLFLYNEDVRLPEIIRLGSFRSPCRFIAEEARFWRRKETETRTVDHPVDPLLSEVHRGTMVNILPYGIVANATVKGVYEAVFSDGPKSIADHNDTWLTQKLAECEEEIEHARKCLEASKSEKISEPERAYVLMQALRGLTSIVLLLRHQFTQERLETELYGLDGFEKMREAVKNEDGVPNDILMKIREHCYQLLDEIRGEENGPTQTPNTNDGLIQI